MCVRPTGHLCQSAPSYVLQPASDFYESVSEPTP